MSVAQAKTLLSGMTCDIKSLTAVYYQLIYVFIDPLIAIHYHPSTNLSIYSFICTSMYLSTAIDASAIEKIRALQVVAMVRTVDY